MSNDRHYRVEKQDTEHGTWSCIGPRQNSDDGLHDWDGACSFACYDGGGIVPGRRIVDARTGEAVFPLHEREDSRADLHELDPDFIGYEVRSIRADEDRTFWHHLTLKGAVKHAAHLLERDATYFVGIRKRPLMFVSRRKLEKEKDQQ
jgi:hypothetical protein